MKAQRVGSDTPKLIHRPPPAIHIPKFLFPTPAKTLVCTAGIIPKVPNIQDSPQTEPESFIPISTGYRPHIEINSSFSFLWIDRKRSVFIVNFLNEGNRHRKLHDGVLP